MAATRINIVSIFPDFFRGPLSLSIPGRAAQDGLVEYRLVDLRDYTHDRHRTVDDVPYGGGAGMVMKQSPSSRRWMTWNPTGRWFCYRLAGSPSSIRMRSGSAWRRR